MFAINTRSSFARRAVVALALILALSLHHASASTARALTPAAGGSSITVNSQGTLYKISVYTAYSGTDYIVAWDLTNNREMIVDEDDHSIAIMGQAVPGIVVEVSRQSQLKINSAQVTVDDVNAVIWN